MTKFLNFLQSNKAVLFAAMLSLSTQLWHSVRAFVSLDVGGEDNYWNYLFGIMFSISTSFAILLFTVRGRKRLAYFFLAVEVFINVIHYSVLDMDLGPILMATIFMCIIVPVTIAVYSSEIKTDGNHGDHSGLTGEYPKRYIMGVDPIGNTGDGKSFVYTKEKTNPKDENNSAPYDGTINKQSIDDEFISEVNNIIGFDITNPGDKSGNVSEDKKKELRSLWRKRKQMPHDEIIGKIKGILDESGSPLFR